MRANTTMSVSERRLVLLNTRYPGSRMTLWRIQREADFPVPIVIRGRRYYYSDELDAFEARRRGPRSAAEGTAKVAANAGGKAAKAAEMETETTE
jgi:hypothetical protein